MSIDIMLSRFDEFFMGAVWIQKEFLFHNLNSERNYNYSKNDAYFDDSLVDKIAIFR